MKLFDRSNKALSRFPPLVIYAIGMTDITILVFIAYWLGYSFSKISQ